MASWKPAATKRLLWDLKEVCNLGILLPLQQHHDSTTAYLISVNSIEQMTNSPPGKCIDKSASQHV